MISLHFNIPIQDVEKQDLRDYRLMLFTVFNNAVLHSMDASKFKFQTDEDETNDFIKQIEEVHKRGLDL